MVKDIENSFFKEFAYNHGVVRKCFKWIEDSKSRRMYATSSLLHFYNSQEKGLKEQAEAFYDRVIFYKYFDITCSPLLAEITDNLAECADEQAKEQYAVYLLLRFGEYSDIMYHREVLENYQKRIEQYEKELETWKQAPESIEKKSQINRLQSLIRDFQFKIASLPPQEQLESLAKKYKRLSSQQWPCGTVEDYCSRFLSFITRYALFVGAILHQHNINLIHIQEKCGVYLLGKMGATDMEYPFSSLEMTQQYIDETLPKLPDSKKVLPDELAPTTEPKQQNKVKIPKEFDTEMGKRMLEALIEEGFCDEKYTWNEDKWDPDRDVMGLTCLAVAGTKELGLKTMKYVDSTDNKQKEATQWYVFEKLFNYRNKKEGKSHLKNQKSDYQKNKCAEFNPREMDVIKAFFERLKNKEKQAENT